GHLREPRGGWAVPAYDGLDVALDVVRQSSERDAGDSLPAQDVPDESRIDLISELARLVEVALERLVSIARVREVALQALLEISLGAREDVVPKPDPDQDPDRERQEHGGERGGVGAARVPHQLAVEDRSQPSAITECRG